LVVHDEGPRADGVSQGVDQGETFATVGIGFVTIGRHPGVGPLGVVHRDVGAAQELAAGLGVGARERHTDAGSHAHARAVEDARVRQGLGQFVGDGHQVLLSAHGAVTGVLVAPETGQHPALAQAVLETLGHHA
jgi:hypothetical protein